MDWLERCRERTWKSFDNPEDEPVWSLATDSLLDGLDELNGKMVDGLTMFAYWRYDETHRIVWEDKATVYWKAVKDLITEHVDKNAFNDDPVAENIIRKLVWYRSKLRDTRLYRLWIPILTPKMLDALRDNISARAKAYEEVGVILLTFPLRVYTMFKRGGIYQCCVDA